MTAGPETCFEEHTGAKQPQSGQSPLFSVAKHAYFSDGSSQFTSGPELAIYPDGTAAITPDAGLGSQSGPQSEPDPLQPMLGGWIDPCTFESVVENLEQVAAADYGQMLSVMDGGFAEFSYHPDSGAEQRFSVDQFGIADMDGKTSDLTRAQYDARQKLHRLIAEIEDAIQEPQPLADRVRIVKSKSWADAADGETTVWPGLAEYSKCEVLTGSAAEEARGYFMRALIESRGDEPGNVRATGGQEDFIDPESPEEPVSVAFAQLLPGTGACANLELFD